MNGERVHQGGMKLHSVYIMHLQSEQMLTLKASITTADDIHKYFFHAFREKKT